MKDYKRIIDSVHGNININKEYIINIVDTPEFQRLRRIEQTSTRAIFPSARHDRFIHSIGVFYMGHLIAKQLTKIAKNQNFFGIGDDVFKKIVEAYRIACLLHDVGHAPFSHTFEDYYGANQEIADRIYKVLPQVGIGLRADLDPMVKGPKPHELASAYLTIFVKAYKDFIGGKGLDPELIVRMIIGCSYSDETTPINQIKNCFISLLNGEVIDADRLDYACRDVWASGYATSSIDMKRLISGLHIRLKEGKFIVCFSSNVLNEIESVLDVKEFQTKYILNHHTVVYEQYLLQEAAKTMAIEYADYQELQRDKAFSVLSENEKLEYASRKVLSTIISLETISNKGKETNGNTMLRLVADDDLVFLMKQQENELYDEWESRQYSRLALWKTRDEFFALFPLIDKDVNFDDTIKKEIIDAIKAMGFDVLVLLRKFSPRLTLNSLNICIGNDEDNQVLTYDQLYRSQICETDKVFPFVYIKKCEHFRDSETLKHVKPSIIHSLAENVMCHYISKDKNKTPEVLISESLSRLSYIRDKVDETHKQSIIDIMQKLKLTQEKLIR